MHMRSFPSFQFLKSLIYLQYPLHFLSLYARNNVKLSQVIDELVEEKGLDRAVLSGIICEGMLAAYKKRYPDLPIAVSYNKKTDEIDASLEKNVVSSVEDEDLANKPPQGSSH